MLTSTISNLIIYKMVDIYIINNIICCNRRLGRLINSSLLLYLYDKKRNKQTILQVFNVFNFNNNQSKRIKICPYLGHIILVLNFNKYLRCTIQINLVLMIGPLLLKDFKIFSFNLSDCMSTIIIIFVGFEALMFDLLSVSCLMVLMLPSFKSKFRTLYVL